MMKKHNKHIFILISLLVFIFTFLSCNITHTVPTNKYLVNTINLRAGNLLDEIALDRDELASVIKQKRNRSILLDNGPRFYLRAYNFGNRLGNNFLGRWLTNKVGEEPVFYDSILAKKSAKQLNLLLINKGYFNNVVKDTVYFKKKKANISYTVLLNDAYKIESYKNIIDDSLIKSIVNENIDASLIIKKNNYKKDDLDAERERITRLLKNNGYYFFDKIFLNFDVYTNEEKKQVEINLRLNRLKVENTNTLNNTPYYLKKYLLNNIYIDLDYNQLNAFQSRSDTEAVTGYKFVYNKQFDFSRAIIKRSIFFEQGAYYSINDVENTYKSLSDLKTFKFVNIQFVKNTTDTFSDYLDVFVQLAKNIKQNTTYSLEGSNTGLGNLGIAGYVGLVNKNVFKNAENFELKLKAGIENQVLQIDSVSNRTARNFNTILIAPELSFSVPKHFLFTKLNNERQVYKPRTLYTAAFNYQDRPDYRRTIFNTTMAGIWRFKPEWTLIFPQFDINFVSYNLSNVLDNRLSLQKNERLRLAFTNIFITSIRGAIEKSSQAVTSRSNYHYFRGGLEIAGTLNYLLNKYLLKNPFLNADSQYVFFSDKNLGIQGSPFANFSRLDLEYRYFNPINKKSSFVYRLLGGVALPYWNSGNVVPYTKTFFAGGSNDIRAWDALSLGPGGFASNDIGLNRIGDLKIEANAEIRFPIVKFFKGAFFVDAGNVWLLNRDIRRKNGTFFINNFYKEIAVGSGIGLRLDLTYFIIRLDFATKVIDPERPLNNNWVLPHIYSKSWNNEFREQSLKRNPALTKRQASYEHINLNFGIGYPF